MTEPKNSAEFSKYVKEGKYDFVDFGCSKGGSIDWSMKFLGGKRGLGIDISPPKVTATKEAGFDAIEYNLLKLPQEKLFRFAILSHMLEHVPDLKMVQAFIQAACVVSKEFVLIRQPYFDSDGMLFQHGLKTYWSDWHGHPNCMTTFDLYKILQRLKDKGLVKAFSIHGKTHIPHSDHPRVHPLSSPEDQHAYDPDIHPPKPKRIDFDFPVYFETVAFITMGDLKSHMEPFKNYPMDITFIDADGTQPGISTGAVLKKKNLVAAKTTRHSFIEAHCQLDSSSTILEFGALDNPTFRRPEYTVKYLDYASKEELNEKNSANPRYALDKLVDVDFVGLGSVDQTFELAVANHVIEHVPDIIGWINDIADILTKDGRLFLSIPDKRYTFDIARRETNFIDLMRMDRNKVEKPDFYQILDHLYFHKKVNAKEAWAGGIDDKLKTMRFSPQAAVEAATKAANSSYASVHCHVFTRDSFEETYNILVELGLVTLKLDAISSPAKGSNEFYAVFSHI